MTDLIVESDDNIELVVGTQTPVELEISEAFIGYDAPTYEGSYSVTPSAAQQVLETDGLIMTDDVTVAAVPLGSVEASVSISGKEITATASVTTDGYVDSSNSDIVTATMPSASFADTVLAYREMNRSILSTAGTDAGGYIAANKIKQNHVPVADVLPTQSGVTITPSTISQIASYAYRWLTGNITVEPIPQEYIVPSGTKSITANGTGIDVSSYQYADVAVPGTTPSGTKSISVTSNGTTTHDVSGYASASVTANVPNTYAAGDEGKVVSSGALVSQTSATYTENGTYDTTLINSVTVNASGGGDVNVTQDANGYIVVGDSAPSGGSSAVKSYIYQVVSEQNIYSAFVAMGIKAAYNHSAFLAYILGASAATSGNTYTNNNYVFTHTGTTVNYTRLNQRSSKVAPDALVFQPSETTLYTFTATVSNDGSVTVRTDADTIMLPAGSVLVVVEIPYSSNGAIDTTPFGS